MFTLIMTVSCVRAGNIPIRKLPAIGKKVKLASETLFLTQNRSHCLKMLNYTIKCLSVELHVCIYYVNYYFYDIYTKFYLLPFTFI